MDDGGPGAVGARRLPEEGPEGGGTRKAPETGAGHGTFAGGAPTSKSEAAEGAPTRREPEEGGPAETEAEGRKLVEGGGAAGGAATGAANDVVTGPAGRARWEPLSGPRRRNRAKSFGGAVRPSGGGGGRGSSSAVSGTPSKCGVTASSNTVS